MATKSDPVEVDACILFYPTAMFSGLAKCIISCNLASVSSLQISSAFSNMVSLHNLSEEAVNAEHEKYARIGEVSVFRCGLGSVKAEM